MDNSRVPKYVLVGGNPFRCYTGTVACTGLSVVGNANTKKQMAKITTAQYDKCGGLLIWIDTRTGKEV